MRKSSGKNTPGTDRKTAKENRKRGTSLVPLFGRRIVFFLNPKEAVLTNICRNRFFMNYEHFVASIIAQNGLKSSRSRDDSSRLRLGRKNGRKNLT
jgi:hypothetical protein